METPTRGRPVVLHAPSHAGIKGSVYVESACESLVAREMIDYVRLQGVPAEAMPAKIAEADIVVDQLLLGSYGVAACEAMAAGRVVVGNVDLGVREGIRMRTGLEVPIVQATPENLEDVLAELVEDEDRRREVAAAGRHFVQHVHSGSQTQKILAPFLSPGD